MKSIWIINHYATPPSISAWGRHYFFSRHLQNHGFSVKIFTSSKIHNTNINMIEDGAPYKEMQCDGVDSVFIRTDDYQKNGLSRIKNMLEFPARLWGVCKQFEKPDVIYTSSPSIFAAFRAVQIARKLKVPCILEVRDLWPESLVAYTSISPQNPVVWMLYRLEKWMYKKADRLVFTMEGGWDYIQDKGWDKEIPRSKVFHINNGIDLASFDAQMSTKEAKHNGEDAKVFTVVFAGSIRKVNRLDIILDAAKIIQDRGINIQIQLWGQGDDEETLKEKARDMGLTSVHFMGFVKKDKVPAILAGSDLNLLHYQKAKTQQYGGSQNKLFEYLACGKPILSTIEEEYSLIERHNAGVVVKDQSPEAIAGAIIEMATLPPEQYAQYCKKAREASLLYDFNMLTGKLIHMIKGMESA